MKRVVLDDHRFNNALPCYLLPFPPLIRAVDFKHLFKPEIRRAGIVSVTGARAHTLRATAVGGNGEHTYGAKKTHLVNTKPLYM